MTQTDPIATRGSEPGGDATAHTEQPLVVALRALASRYVVVLVLLLMMALFSVLLPRTFPTSANLGVMVNSQAILLLLALAATITLRSGDFDLSIAATMVLSAAISGSLSRDGAPLLLVLPLGVLVGLTVGLANGLLVVRAGLNSFVTTLGMSTALAGVTLAVTDSRVISSFGSDLRAFTRTDLLGLPLSTWYGWLAVVVLWYVYQRTASGRYMLFIGGNRNAALLAGVPVARIRVASYVSAGALSAFAGLVLAGYLGAVDPGIGPQFLLQPFAAAFLGATAIHVGRFNAVGTVVALYLLVVGITGLQLYGAPFWVADLFNGIALVLAVAFARIASRQVQS